MAKQEGIILLTGRVGNISFYKMGGRYYARRISGVSAHRIKTDPVYARTRENIAEFGRASHASKLLRRALAPWIRSSADCRVTGRLTAAMLSVIKTDVVNARGKRIVSDGQSALLKGFEFNKKLHLTARFMAPYSTSMDRVTGAMSIDVPAFNASDMISAPKGATHFRLMMAAVALDFEHNTFTVQQTEAAVLPLSEKLQPQLQLSANIKSSQSHTVTLVMGIRFLQLVNDAHYALSDGACNAMAIVHVDPGTKPSPAAAKPAHRNVLNRDRQPLARPTISGENVYAFEAHLAAKERLPGNHSPP